MPELPEVETVVRQIRPRLVGRTLVSAEASWRRTVGELAPAELRRRLVGRRVRAVTRRAKYILIELERSERAAGWLLGHLRMTGRLFVEPAGAEHGPHLRVRLGLDDGRELRFVDPRKFGRLLAVDDPAAHLAELGPEPLGPDFTGAWLHAALRARRRALKPLLLDQTFLAGLGNIYVDEALFRARLHPLRSSDRVDAAAADRLACAIRTVLAEAIEREGSSFDTFYRTPEGRPGSYQHQFQVYGRDGRPCVGCGAPVRRLLVAQRGTHVCPRCQPPPRAPRRRRAVLQR